MHLQPPDVMSAARILNFAENRTGVELRKKGFQNQQLDLNY